MTKRNVARLTLESFVVIAALAMASPAIAWATVQSPTQLGIDQELQALTWSNPNGPESGSSICVARTLVGSAIPTAPAAASETTLCVVDWVDCSEPQQMFFWPRDGEPITPIEGNIWTWTVWAADNYGQSDPVSMTQVITEYGESFLGALKTKKRAITITGNVNSCGVPGAMAKVKLIRQKKSGSKWKSAGSVSYSILIKSNWNAPFKVTYKAASKGTYRFKLAFGGYWAPGYPKPYAPLYGATSSSYRSATVK